MKKEFYNIANLVTKKAKILDVGCGNGELMKYITENISKEYTPSVSDRRAKSFKTTLAAVSYIPKT